MYTICVSCNFTFKFNGIMVLKIQIKFAYFCPHIYIDCYLYRQGYLCVNMDSITKIGAYIYCIWLLCTFELFYSSTCICPSSRPSVHSGCFRTIDTKCLQIFMYNGDRCFQCCYTCVIVFHKYIFLIIAVMWCKRCSNS